MVRLQSWSISLWMCPLATLKSLKFRVNFFCVISVDTKELDGEKPETIQENHGERNGKTRGIEVRFLSYYI